MKTNRRFLNSGAGSEGGPTQTIADLMSVQADDIPSLEEAETTADDDENKGDNPAGADSANPKGDAKPAGEEETDDDTDPNKDKGEPGDENQDTTTSDDVLAYWAEVEAALGVEFEWADDELPADLDPANTAKVIELISKKAMGAGAEQFEQFLKENHPQAYNYFLYLDGGGDPDTFFEQAPKSVHDEQVVKENVDLQRAYLTNFLQAKGLGETEVKTLITAYETDKLLETKSLEARKFYEDAETQFAADQQKAQADATARKVAAQTNFTNSVEDLLKTGKIGTIAIPEVDRVDFAKNLIQSVDITADGKIFLKTEVNAEDFASIIAKEYIGFKKGDLSKIVATKAKTEATKSLKLRMSASAKVPGSAAQAKAGSDGVGGLMNIMKQLDTGEN